MVSVRVFHGFGVDMTNEEHYKKVAELVSGQGCCLCGGDTDTGEGPVAVGQLEPAKNERHLYAPGDVPETQVSRIFYALCKECANLPDEELGPAVEKQIKEDMARSRGEEPSTGIVVPRDL